MGRKRQSQSQNMTSKRAYARISLKRRKMLINLVVTQGFSIARAIKKLSLKLTTARFILQKYRETGAYPMKHFRKHARMFQDLPQANSEEKVKLENSEEVIEPKVEETQRAQDQQILQPEVTAPTTYYYYYIPFAFA